MTTTSVEKLEADVKARREELERLERELEQAKSEPADIRLARELHDLNCTGNHTDGCGWFWEMHDKVDDWNARTHYDYLNRARTLIRFCECSSINPKDAIGIFRMVRGY